MNPFFIVFIGIPALEILLLIKIGGQIGALNTVALIFLTALMGIFCKNTRNSNIEVRNDKFISKQNTSYEMISGASIAFAALLLIIPGFFTDFIGFLFLIPFTRKLVFSLAFKNKSKTKR